MSGAGEVGQQVRGSALLLSGHLLSLGLNFASQVLIVRSLSKSGFGVFAFGLSIVTLGQTLALFGFDRGVQRFIPIYDEEGRPERILGVLLMVGSVIVGLSAAVVLVVAGFSEALLGSLADEPAAATVLLVLVALVPLEAADRLMISLFAIYTRPAAIFVRKYVLSPGLRLLVVLALVVGDAGVTFLAAGYAIAGGVGVAVYAPVLVATLRRRGVLTRETWRGRRVPARALLAFTLPLLTTDLVFSTMNAVDAVMLGQLGTTEDVAEIRAVFPVARLNQVVLTAFGILFTPAASRLFAREDHAGIDRLYWQTALWVALLSFPVLAVTLPFATPVTELLFGERYESAGTLLAIMAGGYYVHAALGFNGMTLNVYAAVRYVLVVNLVAGGLNIVLNLALIPSFGATGAAVATAATLLLHNLGKQLGLRLRTRVTAARRDVLPAYLSILAGVGALMVVATVWSPPLWVALPLAAAVSVVVVGANRSVLELGDTFPELARLPIVGRLTRRRP